MKAFTPADQALAPPASAVEPGRQRVCRSVELQRGEAGVALLDVAPGKVVPVTRYLQPYGAAIVAFGHVGQGLRRGGTGLSPFLELGCAGQRPEGRAECRDVVADNEVGPVIVQGAALVAVKRVPKVRFDLVRFARVRRSCECAGTEESRANNKCRILFRHAKPSERRSEQDGMLTGSRQLSRVNSRRRWSFERLV